MSFFGGIIDFFKSNTIVSSLAKTALLGYASRLLNDTTSSDTSSLPPAVDPGVRVQLDPSTDTKIPVLYGDAFFGGNITDAAISSDLKTMWYVLALAETTGTKLSDSIGTNYTFHDVYLNNNRVVFKSDGYTVDYTLDQSSNQDINMRDLVKIYFYVDGVATQPDGYVGTTPAANTLIPHWITDPTNYAYDGLIYAVVEVTYNQSKGITGLPNCLFHVESDMTLPGDVLHDYMTNSVYGANIPAADIDDSLVALNTYCSAGFTYTDRLGVPGQSGRVDVNGLVDTKTPCLRNMEEIAASANSWMSYNIHQGQWSVIINDVTSTSATITDSHIIGEIGITGTSLTQLHNAVDVKYQNTDILDKTDFVKMSINPVDLYANEPDTTLNLNLPFTNKQVVAMKVGLIALKQARADKIVKFTTDYSFINLHAGEVVSITSPSINFSGALYRIINVREVEDASGVINVEFTALEYNSTIYDYDITELDIETDSGILTAGAIGKPNIPVVTNNEQGNMPHVLIEADTPSGIVETMEFWITYDTTEPNDDLRNYALIGQTYNTNGDSYTQNTHVTYRYNSLQTADFFIKTRGTNAVTTGPFSDPSGLIEYVPTVVADTLSDTPTYDPLGQIMSLGLLTLLNNLDELLEVFNGEKSIADALKEIFFPGSGDSTETAAEALLNDSTFTTGVTGSATLLGLTDTAVDLAFANEYLMYDGVNWVPSEIAPGSGAQYINELLDVNSAGAQIDDTLVWDGSNWVPQSGCCEAAVCFFNIGFSGLDIEGNIGITGAELPTAGTGNIYLYKNDGTLISTKTAADLIINGSSVSIPFPNRDACTKYYILADQGILRDCHGCTSNKVCSPAVWRTENDLLPEVTEVPYDNGVGDPTDPYVPPPPAADTSIKEGSTDCQATYTGLSGDITIEFNQNVRPGDGNIYIKNGATIVHTFSACDLMWDESTHQDELLRPYFIEAVIPSFLVTPGVNYSITSDADFVVAFPTDPCVETNAITFTPTSYESEALRGPDSAGKGQNTTATPEVDLDMHGNVTQGTGTATVKDRDTGATIKTVSATDLGVTFEAASDPVVDDAFYIVAEVNPTLGQSSPLNTQAEVSMNTNIELRFNKPYAVGTGNFYLYNGVTLVDTWDITDDYNHDKISGRHAFTDEKTIILSPTKCLDPETVYHIRCDAGVVTSKCQVPLAAITDNTVLKFTTISKVTPTITLDSPLPNSNQSVNETGMLIDAPGTLAPGNGSLRIYDSNNNLIDTITSGDSRVSFIA